MPIFAVLSPATNVGDAHYSIQVLHEHSPERTKSWFQVDAETTVAVKQSASISGSSFGFPRDDVHGDTGSILTVVEHLLSLKRTRIVIQNNIFTDDVRLHLKNIKTKMNSWIYKPGERVKKLGVLTPSGTSHAADVGQLNSAKEVTSRKVIQVDFVVCIDQVRAYKNIPDGDSVIQHVCSTFRDEVAKSGRLSTGIKRHDFVAGGIKISDEFEQRSIIRDVRVACIKIFDKFSDAEM